MFLFNRLVRKVFVLGPEVNEFDIKFNLIDPETKVPPEYIRGPMAHVEKVGPEKEYKSIEPNL